MKCDVCAGRGWVPAAKVPAEPCSFCGGRGELTWGMVARKLGEDPDTLARVRQLRCRPKTAERVFNKIAAVLWPEAEREQREMFG